MKNFIKFRLLLCAVLIHTAFIGHAQDYLVFDIGGVLTKVKNGRIALKCGIWDFIRYPFLTGKSPAHLKRVLFSALTEIGGVQRVEPGSCAATYEGTPHPKLLCDWKEGKISGKELMKIVTQAIDSPHYRGILKKPIEKAVIKKILEMMVSTDLLARYTHPNRKTVKLLRACAKNGNIRFMILSNHDKELFDKLFDKPELRKLFCYFERRDIFVSGHTGMLKPYASTYESLKNRINFDPHKDRIFFFDDEKTNVDEARKHGFIAYHYVKRNYKNIRRCLRHHCVIT